MFQAEALSQHLKTSHTLETNAKVFAEWNMNFPDNIAKLGNYRYRPNGTQAEYKNIVSNYDPNENAETLVKYYYGATDADIVFDGGYPNEQYADINPSPELFVLPKEKFGMLYSLEDCVKPFRPRSGINKILYLGTTGSSSTTTQYLDNPGKDLATRPRYYVSSKHDQFKYWTSYRTEVQEISINDKRTVERGISQIPINGRSYIDDACPFVVYKNSVPANRLVVKMQTNVGTSDRGTFRKGSITMNDPLYGYINQTTPVRWSIQILKGSSWVTAISFDENSLREDGTTIIGADGYVEISYGLQIPDEYKDTFVFAGELLSVESLPITAPNGYTYLVKDSALDRGTMYVYDTTDYEWKSFVPQYNWGLAESFVSKNSKFASKLVNPDYFMSEGNKVYREIEIVDGIRIVVETMNKQGSTFDLIEFSPRLALDISDRTIDFSVTKTLSDLGNSSVPVGTLLASQGSIDIANDDLAFLDTNTFDFQDSSGSIIAQYLETKIKFDFYEVVKNVEETTGTYDYFVPIKTLYSEGVPQSTGNFDLISLQLRDAYTILESSPAPSILLTNVSLSYAIMVLLDYIGFSNYVFKRKTDQQDPIIPYFFVAPNQNVAEVLTQLARATQSAMFFDEYNNFVVMMKEYLLPSSEADRATDLTLYGQEEFGETIEELPGFTNKAIESLPNIISLSANSKKVYNGGQINYTTRYIQRSYGSIQQAPYTSEYKNWIYLPSLLWEVSGTENLRTINEPAGDQASYTLAAAPLSTTLTTDVPRVENNILVNNIIDVGESVYWISKYNGYLYANGEIIKYDAMQYSITGQEEPVWISSNREYQEYFGNLPFNGKMYPTGNLRIYSEPKYETINGVTRLQNGDVNSHGRGQFGTTITSHSAGLDSYWTNNDNVYGCVMEADYIFSTSRVNNYPSPLTLSQNSPAGVEPTRAKRSSRNGIIKNMMANTMLTDGQVSKFISAQAGTMQSSALVFTGPSFESGFAPKTYISYIHKPLSSDSTSAYPYRHFGTRMRIIGKIESENNKEQTPIGNNEYISINPADSSNTTTISGGSGGIGIMVNPNTNNGYFYEIVALTKSNSSEYITNNKTIVSYNITAGKAGINANRATIETDRNHEFIVGDKVTLSGFDIAELNGEFVIDQTTKQTFSFPLTADNGTTATGGTAKVYISTDAYLSNIIFYKIVSDQNGKAIPYKLWSGLANILVDDGKFTGQYRFAGEDNPTVYDLDIEYKENITGNLNQQPVDTYNTQIITSGNMSTVTSRTFYLYLNGKQIATVIDDKPLPRYNNVALFVRGASKCMFENVYALSENYSQNTTFNVLDNIADVFGTNDLSANDSLRKYSVSGLVQASYLSGINSYEPPKYKMYFEEFGTIMREAAYFNIKYDRAYPALYAKLSPTLNRVKGYVTSGFFAGAYGAEFLIFNCVDKTINLDATTGNYLRIQGVTFTQNTTNTLTVDDYFKKVSNLADPQLSKDIVLYNPNIQKETYDQIKISRMKYGISEFAPIDSVYIQNEDMAEDVLGWLINRTMYEKRNIGITVFGMPIIQLGDIVNINYKKLSDGELIDMVSSENTRYIVYNIEYKKGSEDTTTTLYLSEV